MIRYSTEIIEALLTLSVNAAHRTRFKEVAVILHVLAFVKNADQRSRLEALLGERCMLRMVDNMHDLDRELNHLRPHVVVFYNPLCAEVIAAGNELTERRRSEPGRSVNQVPIVFLWAGNKSLPEATVAKRAERYRTAVRQMGCDDLIVMPQNDSEDEVTRFLLHLCSRAGMVAKTG